MMAKLEADRDMELNERQKLAEEIRAKPQWEEKVDTRHSSITATLRTRPSLG